VIKLFLGEVADQANLEAIVIQSDCSLSINPKYIKNVGEFHKLRQSYSCPNYGEVIVHETESSEFVKLIFLAILPPKQLELSLSRFDRIMKSESFSSDGFENE
jgi:hypothetical protein